MVGALDGGPDVASRLGFKRCQCRMSLSPNIIPVPCRIKKCQWPMSLYYLSQCRC